MKIQDLIRQLTILLTTKYGISDLVGLHTDISSIVAECSVEEIDTKDPSDYSESNKSIIDQYLYFKKLRGDKHYTIYNAELQLRRFQEITTENLLEFNTNKLYELYNTVREKYHSSGAEFISHAKRLYAYLRDQGYIRMNPAEYLRCLPNTVASRNKDPLSNYEINLMRSNIPRSDVRQKLVFELLINTGVRVSELVGMKISDIDFYEKRIKVHGKFDKYRYVYYNDMTRLALDEYLKYRETLDAPNDYIFVTKKSPHKQLSTRTVQCMVSALGSISGLTRKVYPHLFRHSFATLAVNRGIPLYSLQLLLGHEKFETTQIYAKLDQTTISNDYRRYIGG